MDDQTRFLEAIATSLDEISRSMYVQAKLMELESLERVASHESSISRVELIQKWWDTE